MATQYEVEHNIKATGRNTQRRRQVDMSSFQSHLHQISTDSDSLGNGSIHNNPHAIPNAADMAGLFRLLQDQMGTLALSAPTEENRAFLRRLFEDLDIDVSNPPMEILGVSQQYLDSLDRVSRKKLKPDDTCPICAEKYLDDPYPLVVELPCHHSHRYDLDCVGPWLLSKGTCPLCRKDLTKKKEVVVPEDDEENDDPEGMYA